MFQIYFLLDFPFKFTILNISVILSEIYSPYKTPKADGFRFVVANVFYSFAQLIPALKNVLHDV